MSSSIEILAQSPDLETILDYGRWTPSGDNVQPWRFRLTDKLHFEIHGFDTREHCVYDLRGHASQLALGMLVESLIIAAEYTGYDLQYELDDSSPVEKPVIHVSLSAKTPKSIQQSGHLDLFAYIKRRTVHRRVLPRKKITIKDKQLLEKAAYPLKVKWFEGFDMYKSTKIFFQSAGIRLRIPEAYPTHVKILEWESDCSRDKMPVSTLGASRLTLGLMRFALKDWRRVRFLNTWMAGTLLPRVEMDVIPGIFSGAHFALLADKENHTVADFIESGRAVQRFWLTASALGIQMQPQMTALIFSHYQQVSINFTTEKNQLLQAEQLRQAFSKLIEHENVLKAVFLGRLGYGDEEKTRSIRLKLTDLLI